jgi:hypothetical protein
MMVEEARIRFSIYTRYREEPTRDEWDAAREELIEFTEKFERSGFIDKAVFERQFAITPIVSSDRESPSPFASILMNRETRPTVSDALVIFRNYIQNQNIGSSNTQESLPLDELKRIIPDQKVAPVQFDIVDGRIVVATRAPRTDEADIENIRSALDHLRGSGEQLLNNLTKSNCDRRLLESVYELHTQVVSGGNIIKTGLTNLACSVMGTQFRDEIPDAIAGMLNAYNASVSLYVAQFPEWEQFAQKAASLDIDYEDVSEVDIAASEIIEALKGNTFIADPEVPRTIAFVRQFLSFPGASSKRAVFAMIRTIENLVSSILKHSLDFLDKTAENLVDTGSKAASKIIIGLLGIALVGASAIGPVATRAGAPWVKQAAEIVQKQIDKVAE